jgi:hypothetical protein
LPLLEIKDISLQFAREKKPSKSFSKSFSTACELLNVQSIGSALVRRFKSLNACANRQLAPIGIIVSYNISISFFQQLKLIKPCIFLKDTFFVN